LHWTWPDELKLVVATPSVGLATSKARAALADNATSLANDEEDPVALKLAISTYEGLLAESTHTAQRMALEQSLSALRKWKH